MLAVGNAGGTAHPGLLPLSVEVLMKQEVPCNQAMLQSDKEAGGAEEAGLDAGLSNSIGQST